MDSKPILCPTYVAMQCVSVYDFRGSNTAKEWSHPFSFVYFRGKSGGSVPSLPRLSSWDIDKLFNHKDNFTLPQDRSIDICLIEDSHFDSRKNFLHATLQGPDRSSAKDRIK
jgi:hypothetical protein